jgi:bleomycin hydrolase
MQKVLILAAAGFMAFQSAIAQNGSITGQALKEIKASYVLDPYTRAMENALSNNELKKLALNRAGSDNIDQYFKYRTDVSGITNQKSSGRCWMFTSLNLFRPVAMKHFNIDAFEYSENYLYFWDIFEKSNLFLNNVIASADSPFTDRKVNWYFRSPIDDGGVWNSFVNLVTNTA